MDGLESQDTGLIAFLGVFLPVAAKQANKPLLSACCVPAGAGLGLGDIQGPFAPPEHSMPMPECFLGCHVFG